MLDSSSPMVKDLMGIFSHAKTPDKLLLKKNWGHPIYVLKRIVHCPKQVKSNSIQIKKRETERRRVGVGERKRKGKEGERGMQDLIRGTPECG